MEPNSIIGKQEKSEPMPENDSLLQRIRFQQADTVQEQLDCIEVVQRIISNESDPVNAVIPVSDLWQMIHVASDIPEELSPAAQRKSLFQILDSAVIQKPTHDIISIRNEIRDSAYNSR